MSIFPKRTLPGTRVTIHWNFNTSGLEGRHIFPFVRIGVKDPEGKISILFEKHVLALPSANKNIDEINNPEPESKHLKKNLPLLIIADYLSGKNSKEKLAEVLQNIESGRHYYFTYEIPENAPLGKYTLISEVHNEGVIKHSTTAIDDFFLVEKLFLVSVSGGQAEMHNPSEEIIPAKLVELDPCSKKIVAEKLINLPPKATTKIGLCSSKSLLFYNEEREVIFLFDKPSPLVIKNHQYLSLNRPDHPEKTYIMDRNTDEAYELEDAAQEIWAGSDGLTCKTELVPEETEGVYHEMKNTGLLQELLINK